MKSSFDLMLEALAKAGAVLTPAQVELLREHWTRYGSEEYGEGHGDAMESYE